MVLDGNTTIPVQDDIPVELDETTQTLAAGVTTLPLDLGAHIATTWQIRLRGSGVPELEEIAAALGSLADELRRNDLDAQAIGGLLTSLGNNVAIVAGQQSSLLSGSLEKLSKVLSAAGTSLV